MVAGVTVDLLADFDAARQHAEAAKSGYAAWARDNCGGKHGGSVSNPTVDSELGKWVAFRTQVLHGARPSPPAMATATGAMLIAIGIQYLDATIPVVKPPSESADRTVVSGTSGQIVGSDGTVWKLTANGQITADGTVDPATNSVVELAYVTHRVWQNAHGLWWSKSKPSDAWTPTAGTNVDPLTGTAPHKVTIAGTPRAGQKLTAAIV
jgi:hypothetical protein